MKISCQSCGAKYNIADEKVRGKIVKIACKKCGARIEIDGRESEGKAQDHDDTRVFDQPNGSSPPGEGTWTVSIDDNDQREVTTDQLGDLVRQGVVTADTFVWRDGMADWQAVRDVAELQSVLASVPPASPSFGGADPMTDVHPQAGYDAPAAPSIPSAYATPSVEASQPARLGGSRRGGAVDLFAQPAAAPEDDDVATSAPSGAALGAMGAAAVTGGKPIGARNENSVLFSLSALTSSGPATAAPVPDVDAEKSGLIDIQKLAAAAKSNGGKDDRAKLDDIMNLGGGGAFGSALGAPILAPPPAAALTEGPADEGGKKSNKGLILAVGGVIALLLIVLIVVLVTSGKKDDQAVATPAPTPVPTAEEKKAAAPTPTEAADPGAAPGTEAPPDPGGGTIGKPGPRAAAGAATGKATAGAAPAGEKPAAPDPPAAAGGAKKPCKTLEECMGGAGGAPKPAEKPPAAAGGEIDKAAAKSALSSVPYKDCGSGGAGKVQVTFGPNGNVTSAVVTAGDYDGGTKNCIQNRFRSAKVPAYGGDPKSFSWSINL